MNKLKYLNKLLYIILLIIGISCSSSSEKVKIGMMLPNTVKERYPKERDYLIAKVKEQGGEVLVADAKNDDKLQIIQAEELINSGINVLVVIAVNKNTAANIVRSAHNKGIKVIAYERIISNCDLDYFISFNNVKIGELLASYALQKKPGGNVVLLGGDKRDQNAVWVREGELKILKSKENSDKIKIVYDIYVEDWSGDNAYYETKRYLNLSASVPDIILSSSDAMSLGAIKALEENGTDLAQFPLITGQNAEISACRNILIGKQCMTVYKPIKNEAEEAAVLAIKLAKKEKVENLNHTSFNGKINVPSILLEPIAVDKSNLRSVIIESGFQKEADIYSK